MDAPAIQALLEAGSNVLATDAQGNSVFHRLNTHRSSFDGELNTEQMVPLMIRLLRGMPTSTARAFITALSDDWQRLDPTLIADEQQALAAVLREAEQEADRPEPPPSRARARL